jgi:hypothetical protein
MAQSATVTAAIACSSSDRPGSAMPPWRLGMAAILGLSHARPPRLAAEKCPCQMKLWMRFWKSPTSSALGQWCRPMYSNLGTMIAATSKLRWSTVLVFCPARRSRTSSCLWASAQVYFRARLTPHLNAQVPSELLRCLPKFQGLRQNHLRNVPIGV